MSSLIAGKSQSKSKVFGMSEAAEDSSSICFDEISGDDDDDDGHFEVEWDEEPDSKTKKRKQGGP